MKNSEKLRRGHGSEGSTLARKVSDMITELQRAGRMKGLGSSDMSSVLGCNPWQSSYDLWCIKTGRAPEFEGNQATRIGNLMEEPLMRYAEEELGYPVERNLTFLDPMGGPLAVNLDGLMRELSANIEGKLMMREVDPNEWGEPGTDSVPSRVIIQTQTAMLCAGLEQSFVPIAFPVFKTLEFRVYRVPFMQEWADVIRERADIFWTKHVLADIPPEDSVGSIEILKKLRRIPGTWATAADADVDRWEQAKKLANDAKKEADAAHAAILAKMEPIDADGLRTESGREYQYTLVNRKAYAAEATSYRQLKPYKKGK